MRTVDAYAHELQAANPHLAITRERRWQTRLVTCLLVFAVVMGFVRVTSR